MRQFFYSQRCKCPLQPCHNENCDPRLQYAKGEVLLHSFYPNVRLDFVTLTETFGWVNTESVVMKELTYITLTREATANEEISNLVSVCVCDNKHKQRIPSHDYALHCATCYLSYDPISIQFLKLCICMQAKWEVSNNLLFSVKCFHFGLSGIPH